MPDAADAPPTDPTVPMELYAPEPPPPPPPPSTPPPPPPLLTAAAPTSPRTGRTVALIASWLAAALVGGVVGGVLVADDDEVRSADVIAGPPEVTKDVPAETAAPLDLRALLAKVQSAVVGVQSLASTGNANGQGSGIIVSPDGEVVTNHHVVSDASTVRVTIAGESSSREADVVGRSENDDLALLRIRDVKGLTVAQLGPSSSVEVGDDVVAIGNALGLRGSPSVTRGIVSALDRSSGNLHGLIQTDAAINPGNSGGPLFDLQGRVIGINTQARSGAQNIGFAIPSDRVRTVTDRIRSGQPVPTAVGYLGVRTRDPVDAGPGAQVVEVTAGGPVEAAGLRVGDRIVAFDGRAVAGSTELGGLVRAKAPGDRVELRITRDGVSQVLTVTLGTRPPDA